MAAKRPVIIPVYPADFTPVRFGTFFAAVAPAAEPECAGTVSDELMALLNAVGAEPEAATVQAPRAPEETAKWATVPKRIPQPKPKDAVKCVSAGKFAGSIIGKKGAVVKALEQEHGVRITFKKDANIFEVTGADTAKVDAAVEACEAILSEAKWAKGERNVWKMPQAKADAELALHKEAAALKKRLRRAALVQQQHAEGKAVETNQLPLLDPAHMAGLQAGLQEVQGTMRTPASMVGTLRAKAQKREH